MHDAGATGRFGGKEIASHTGLDQNVSTLFINKG
jgi:hypothetical protein